MARRAWSDRALAASLTTAMVFSVVSNGVAGQDSAPSAMPVACTPEVEPNDLPPEGAPLVGDLCQSGTLGDPTDQDLILWEVLPEDGLTTWSFWVRGVPTTITSIHVIAIQSAPGVLPLATTEVARADSDAHLDTAPGTAEFRLAPGRYLLGISRGQPGYGQKLTDDVGYEARISRGETLPLPIDIEPNDDAATATAVDGAFELGGDLATSVDHYRWRLSMEDAARLWRIRARTSVGAPMWLELRDAAGVPIASVQAAADGELVVNDLGLPAGDYDISLTPGASGTQPYELIASEVTEAGIDAEPNDTPDRALAVDFATRSAHGRLTSDADIDQYLFSLDAAMAANLVDVDLSWADGTGHTLCISTETGTGIACLQGDGRILLSGMLLPEGRYLLEVSGLGGLDDRYELRVEPGAPFPSSGDREPNDDAATASPVAGAFSVSGDLTGSAPGMGDVFAWALSDADAARTWRLEASGTPGLPTGFGLYGPDGAALAWTQSGQEGTAMLFDLRVPVGVYTIWLTQSGSESPRYVLRAIEETALDVDPEPNNATTQALPLDPATRAARGRIVTSADVDRYSFEVDQAMAADLVELSLTWPSGRLYQLCLNTEYGSSIQCREARDGVALTDLLLAPGPYELQLSGNADPDARYDLSVTGGRSPSLDHEIEPNDLDTAATSWDSTLIMQGSSFDGDPDIYRVHVEPGIPQVWRLEATGTGLGSPLWRQPDGTRVGSVTVWDDGTGAVIEDLYLVQGDHLLTIGADGEYTISLTPLGPPDLAAEHEPNDDPDHAGVLPVGGLRTGRLPAAEEVDVYRFSLSAPEHVVLTVEPPDDGSIGLEITSAGRTLALVAAPAAGQPTVFDGTLPHTDVELWLRPRVPSESTYSVRLERADPFSTGADSDAPMLPASLAFTTSTTDVAAFVLDGQRVEGSLAITNDGPTELALTLDAATSHRAWSVELPSTEVTVPAAGTVEVPVVVHVPADAWLGIPVRVTLRAADAAGAQESAFVEITPGRDVIPVSVEQAWTVPPELLGGLDVASAALGAQSVGSHFHEWDIHDGVSIAGLGMGDSIQNGPLTIGSDLAGDEPIPVAGMILDPLAGDSPFAFRPRAVALLLSEDGLTYEQVLAAELAPQTEHQAFVLDMPVPARFAQLRIDSTWGETPASVYLGEWKVIAAPGSTPTTAGLNLADPVRGGHVVWIEPASQYVFFEILPETDTVLRTLALEAGQPAVWVIGFADDRAAQLTRLEWEDQVGSVPEASFSSVDVAVSLESPLGPWLDLGTWALERASDGSVAPFALTEPAWARFVRLTALGSADASVYRELPSVIRVIERPTDDSYRSILGEWGQSSPRGIYELLVPPPTIVTTAGADAADTPAGATALGPGDAADDSVARSRDVDWYELTVPEGQNTLRIALRTEREGDVRPRLQDDVGRDIAFQLGRTEDPTVNTWTAIVEPGITYHLEVIQPVLSVAVTFDTSASIWPWFPKLRAAVRAFAEDVTPGLEVVQIFPFQQPDLLEGWSDQPYLIGGAMDAWTTDAGSSALEVSITRAAGILAERDGTRAILVLGDAVGGGFEAGGIPVRTLEGVRPAIFPVHLGGVDDPFVSTHIMQDLAAANGGFYQYATSQAAIERAFDRMATWLRRPAPYSLSYQTALLEYPPGTLSVLAPEGASVPIGGGAAVELILDTSGSMRKRLAGFTRISYAQEVMTRLVDETLPEGLPVALRTFQARKRSCDTVMAVPLGPLDRAAMTRVIRELRIERTTRTPLGAALSEVPGDLEGATGPRILVLVTDGKETCQGDPQAAVQALVDAGFETTVNIVGFALEDPALKAEMASWAAIGGGTFFDAQDQDSLLAGIAAALQAPYRVYDQDATLLASGVVGGPPVELSVGTYRVEVLSDPPETFAAVILPPGGGVELLVGEAP